ncbi:MAG: FadR/GntR family transcriptional regulator [Planctomycetota bacterium]|nr:FadR/GntR family transcriptional regulator [Planctomycetota bacterium]
MRIRTIPKADRVGAVVQCIRELIESGNWATGDRIPNELTLCDQLEVSRTVLREAVSGLQSVGILEVRRGVGTFVGSRDSLSASTRLLQSALTISPRDLRTTFEFRRGIEQQAARYAAVKATPADIQELTSLCDAMDQYDYNSVEGLKADYCFHRKVVSMTGNELMRNVMAVLYERIFAANLRIAIAVGNDKRGAAHRPIVEAIRSGNPDKAELAMRDHMDLIERWLP